MNTCQRISLTIVLFLLCSLTAFPQETAAKGKKTDKVFVGYLYRAPAKINFKLYTHLCHAFITADENGVVRSNRNVPSRELAADAHQAGVKVLLSLGGWGWDKQFAAIVSKPEAENRYVRSVLEMVETFDYDGIDLDGNIRTRPRRSPALSV